MLIRKEEQSKRFIYYLSIFILVLIIPYSVFSVVVSYIWKIVIVYINWLWLVLAFENFISR